MGVGAMLLTSRSEERLVEGGCTSTTSDPVSAP